MSLIRNADDRQVVYKNPETPKEWEEFNKRNAHIDWRAKVFIALVVLAAFGQLLPYLLIGVLKLFGIDYTSIRF